MRWEGREQSGNVEDRRGFSVGRVTGIGGIGAVIVALISMYLGQDPTEVLQNLQQTAPQESTQQPYNESTGEARSRQLVATVLKDTETTWHQIFNASGRNYEEPKLVLFSGAVQSACGTAESAVGPFYCANDHKVYIDLSFYDELRTKFGAPGEFAQAYVVAHEIGHHVQNLLGTSDKVHAARARGGEAQSNALSVRMELQADCYAGVWAFNADKSRQWLESGDVEAALNAASAIGDDRLQKQSRGYVSPESFTHGTSAQRVRWFRRGLEAGDVNQCDTFKQSSSTTL